MEHVERQDEREQEIKASADELEHQGDQLEERADEFDEQVDELRDDWEQKQGSADAPGAQDSGAIREVVEPVNESHGGSDADPRPGTSENPGGADEGGQSTGNPPNDDSPAADED